MVFGELEHVFKSGISLVHDEPTRRGAQTFLDRCPDPDLKIAKVMADAFLADRFRQPVRHEYEYKLTSLLAVKLLKPPIEAILYPSVEHVGGINVAATPKAFEEKFKVEGSVVADVTVLPCGIYDIKPIAESTGITDDGKFVWSSPIVIA